MITTLKWIINIWYLLPGNQLSYYTPITGYSCSRCERFASLIYSVSLEHSRRATWLELSFQLMAFDEHGVRRGWGWGVVGGLGGWWQPFEDKQSACVRFVFAIQLSSGRALRLRLLLMLMLILSLRSANRLPSLPSLPSLPLAPVMTFFLCSNINANHFSGALCVRVVGRGELSWKQVLVAFGWRNFIESLDLGQQGG